MLPTRPRFATGILLWSLLCLIVAVLLVAQAVFNLYAGQQACFFNYPTVPCPDGSDPAVARLTFALFGVPAIWFVGLILAIGVRAVRRRRR